MKIAVLNQKGGVGKTTVSVNLAYGLATAGKETLLVDLDPQAHSSVIYTPELPKERTVRELFVDRGANVRDVVIPAQVAGHTVPNLSLVGANIHLARTAEEAIAQPHREKLLERHLRQLNKDYDFVLMDAPPSLNLLTVNAIFAADMVLIPTTYSVYSLDGIADLFKSIAEVKETDEFEFFILRNARDVRTSMTNAAIEDALAAYKHKARVLKTVIRKSEPMNQAAITRQPVQEYAAASHGSEDFSQLTREIIALAKRFSSH